MSARVLQYLAKNNIDVLPCPPEQLIETIGRLMESGVLEQTVELADLLNILLDEIETSQK